MCHKLNKTQMIFKGIFSEFICCPILSEIDNVSLYVRIPCRNLDKFAIPKISNPIGITGYDVRHALPVSPSLLVAVALNPLASLQQGQCSATRRVQLCIPGDGYGSLHNFDITYYADVTDAIQINIHHSCSLSNSVTGPL